MGKRTGITGKYGARYGSTLRKRTRLILEKMKGDSKCPRCETQTVNIKYDDRTEKVCHKCKSVYVVVNMPK